MGHQMNRETETLITITYVLQNEYMERKMEKLIN